MVDAARYAATLRAGRWFADLDDALQAALLSAARVRPVKSGERLFSRGDPPGGLYAVVEGAVTVAATTTAGREVIATRLSAPAWFGEVAVFDRLPRTHDCHADGDGVVLDVPLPALDALLAHEPRWWRDLGVLVAAKLRLAFTAMEDATALPVGARLARRLVMLAEGHGEHVDHTRRVLALSQEQLASMLGASRQTVNQALKDLEGKGLVKVSYGAIELVDVDALRATFA
jgi:CRP-like cAMP-binding protein